MKPNQIELILAMSSSDRMAFLQNLIALSTEENVGIAIDKVVSERVDEGKLTTLGSRLYGYIRHRARRNITDDFPTTGEMTHAQMVRINECAEAIYQCVSNNDQDTIAQSVVLLYLEAWVDGAVSHPGGGVDGKTTSADMFERMAHPDETLIATTRNQPTLYEALCLRLALVIKHNRCLLLRSGLTHTNRVLLSLGSEDAKDINEDIPALRDYAEDALANGHYTLRPRRLTYIVSGLE